MKSTLELQELLLGDEAVALAAVHAGISGAFAYPAQSPVAGWRDHLDR